MKETIIKSKTTLIGIGLAAYAIRLLINDQTVAANGDETTSMILLILSILLGLYLVSIIFYQRLMPHNRRGIALLGVIVIVVAELYFQDSPENYIYMSDILKVIGVFLVIAGPMKLLLSKKAIQAREEKEVEIIEV